MYCLNVTGHIKTERDADHQNEIHAACRPEQHFENRTNIRLISLGVRNSTKNIKAEKGLRTLARVHPERSRGEEAHLGSESMANHITQLVR